MSAAFLLVWQKDGLRPETHRVFDRVESEFPRRVRDMTATERQEPGVRMRLWSHASSNIVGVGETPAAESWLALIGNPVRIDLAGLSGDSMREKLLSECLDQGPRALRSLSPPFAAIFFDGRTNDLHVVGDKCGLQHVYLYRAHDGLMWFSSSSLALAASLSSTLSREGLAEWLACGHFITQRTFFNEIRKLRPGERLTCRDAVSSMDEWSPEPGEFVGDAVTGYIDAFRGSIAMHRGQPTMAAELTGGLDSRLLLAGLLDSRLSFFAWTFGQADCGELRTVELLRERVPFPHVCVSLDDRLGFYMPEAVAEMHALGDGEVNALEYAPLLYALKALDGRRDVSLSGGGGEIARGFYFGVLRARGRRVRGIPVDGLFRRVTRATGAVRFALRNEVVADPDQAARSAIESFVIQSRASHPEQILEDFYIRARMQRFGGRNNSTTGYFCRQGLPYFTNELVDLVLSLPSSIKKDGRVTRGALMRLAPALSEVPLESGIPVPPLSIAAPSIAVSRLQAYARKGLTKYGGRLGLKLVEAAPPTVPWATVRAAPAFREFVTDTLRTRSTRLEEFLEPRAIQEAVDRALRGGSLYPLGLLLTVELTLSRIERTRTD